MHHLPTQYLLLLENHWYNLYSLSCYRWLWYPYPTCACPDKYRDYDDKKDDDHKKDRYDDDDHKKDRYDDDDHKKKDRYDDDDHQKKDRYDDDDHQKKDRYEKGYQKKEYAP